MDVEKPKRCQKEGCKHKLTLSSFPCKCKKYFCGQHRYEAEHECSFNYQEEQKKQLNLFMSSPVLKAKVEIL